jgi:hypothetical protein
VQGRRLIPIDGDERDDSGDEVSHFLHCSGYGEMRANSQDGMPVSARFRLDAGARK